MLSIPAITRCDGGQSVEEAIEAVVKQLGLKPRQTVNEIARATHLSKDEVIFALISLASADRKVAAITAFSLVSSERDLVAGDRR
jgi:hypothetical protein